MHDCVIARSVLWRYLTELDDNWAGLMGAVELAAPGAVGGGCGTVSAGYLCRVLCWRLTEGTALIGCEKGRGRAPGKERELLFSTVQERARVWLSCKEKERALPFHGPSDALENAPARLLWTHRKPDGHGGLDG